MTTKTRYFVIASLLLMTVGLGTGLLAYYVGLQGSPFARHAGPEELKYIPRDATVVAYANVHDVMTSDLRQRVKAAVPSQENGQREFEQQTGINVETDVDRVVACVGAGQGASDNTPSNGLLLARGRFDETKIEGLVRQHGGRVEDYKGKRVLLAAAGAFHGDASTQEGQGQTGQGPRHEVAVAFVEPGLAAVGTAAMVRGAIDLGQGGENITSNAELMTLVKALDSGNAWAVGRFDALRAQARLPAGVASQIPPITYFSVSGHINGGLRGVLRAETRDEEGANNLRDVMRGFMALAKMQSGAKPELQTLVQSLQLGGTGKTVALTFDVPAQVFDLVGPAKRHGH